MSDFIDVVLKHIEESRGAIERKGLKSHDMICDIVKSALMEMAINEARSIKDVIDALGISRPTAAKWAEDYGFELSNVAVAATQRAKKDPLSTRLGVTKEEYAALCITRNFKNLRSVHKLGLSIYPTQYRVGYEFGIEGDKECLSVIGMPAYCDILSSLLKKLGSLSNVRLYMNYVVQEQSIQWAIKNKTKVSGYYEDAYKAAKKLGLYKNKPEIDELIDPNKLL